MDEETTGNMRGSSGLIVVALLAAMLAMPGALAAGQRPKVDELKIDELIALHDLATSVSIGNYYLKQESLLCIRALRTRVGRDECLAVGWNTRNANWWQTEEVLPERMMDRFDRDFADLAWLRPQSTELGSDVFDDQELDALISRFRSGVGKKQLQIVDHTISTHVMMTLSFSGKLRSLPGVEDERMRFSIQDTTNADGQAFALSPLRKEYFATAILNLTGVVHRRIDDIALQLLRDVERHGETVRPYLDGFESASI